MTSKHIFVIGGPNGAGKTTAAQVLLPEELELLEFVNADEIARGLSPFNVEGVAMAAGRIMIDRMRWLVYLPLADNASIYDNSDGRLTLIASRVDGGDVAVHDRVRWAAIEEASR
jgi:predicted ABC-type ATPase